MKPILSFSLYVLLLLQTVPVFSQQINFNLVNFKDNNWGVITGIAQDRQGYIWFTSKGGLHKYDGDGFVNYTNDSRNDNSLAGNDDNCIFIDSSDNIWIGTNGAGLDRLDPATNTFTHFRHNPKDSTSLADDNITAILEDRAGNLWIGTFNGLNLLDRKTGKFVRYANNPVDAETISSNFINVIYEDREGRLWVGCGSPFFVVPEKPEEGGLNRLNRATGKFTRYLHDPGNPNSIANNKVSAIFEDSKGNFWIGTAGDGLHIMNRATGIFTHYYYDAAHPENLSRPPLNPSLGFAYDHIRFIREDITGAIWIGSLGCGINRYDPVTNKIKHYGYITKGTISITHADTAEGFKNLLVVQAISSKDGLFWISTGAGLYNINLFKITIPYYNTNDNANSFYLEPSGNILWIATGSGGLIRKDLNTNQQKQWRHDPLNSNSLCNDSIGVMRIDEEGKFWLATSNGLSKFDPVANTFTSYLHNEKKPGSLSCNAIDNLCIDNDKNLWVATNCGGLDKMDTKTGLFTHYTHDDKDSGSLVNNNVVCVTKDKSNTLWLGTVYGVDKMKNNSGKFQHYLPSALITSICVDADGIVWAGSTDGLYYFDFAKDKFLSYNDQNSGTDITEVLHILEDDKKNLWVSTAWSIVKINAKRNEEKIYGKSYGVHRNTFYYADNFKANNGQLFLGDQSGYYAFFPDKIKDQGTAPLINFTSFKLGNEELRPAQGSILTLPVWQSKEISLNYRQNVFSFDFRAVHYNSPGEEKYLFMLENYDDAWHDIGSDHRAYFFNVPPGTYIFHAKAVNADGVWGEKTIKIIITPPWWRTWWAYTIFVLFFVGIIWGFIVNRSRILRKENRILEEKVAHRTIQLKQSLDELKSAQTQLIQSEKMASLGELTAGIAHEIQNPLNFVNNFSEVNQEMVDEAAEEIGKGNYDVVKIILSDIKENSEKINHHGKRADAIVKGMLQHSRASSGQKELTDINKLADEYLRLSYHGFRAKDKSFNSQIKTDFDESIGEINIVPQDIGRVLLNLFNNAFYAVNEKNKTADENYQPTVTVKTKNLNSVVEIIVQDNGPGIPQNIVDKIFQPFFTTKPTGQGTGLGLSLAYDIVKAHGGSLELNIIEGIGSEFKVLLHSL